MVKGFTEKEIEERFKKQKEAEAKGIAPTQRQGNLFGEVNALKGKRENQITDAEKEEREKAKFSDKTRAGRIARHPYFEYITLGVIVYNALYLGYDCDYNARWGKPDDLYASSLWGFILMDHFFCLFFTVELVIRFLAYKSKLYSCKDLAFLFDLALVALMILETWVLPFVGSIPALKQVSILRLLRLARLLRMGKIMRYLPEMQLIVKGMLAAVRSVGCAAILMLLCLYVFSIIFTTEYHQGLKADDDEDLTGAEFLFGSMGKSMRHLLIMGTIMDDITACTNTIRSTDSLPMLIAFFVLIILSAFTLFNMLVGILCEVVVNTGERERSKREQSRINEVLLGFFRAMDMDGNGFISREEFLSMQGEDKIMDALNKLDIDDSNFVKYAELLFTPTEDGEPPPSLDYHDAVSMIMRLRPGQMVNACDFGYFQVLIKRAHREILSQLESIEGLLKEVDAAIADNEKSAQEEKEERRKQITGRSNEGGSGKRTLASLAHSRAADLGHAPSLNSKWQEILTESPRSDRNPRKIEDVRAHLEYLVGKRQIMASKVWEYQVNSQPVFYQRSFDQQMPELNNAVEDYVVDEEDSYEEERPPLLD